VEFFAAFELLVLTGSVFGLRLAFLAGGGGVLNSEVGTQLLRFLLPNPIVVDFF
jgi:hypothetical protein